MAPPLSSISLCAERPELVVAEKTMSTVATSLAVVGPLMATVGAAFLAYDAVRGPMRWYQQVFFVRGALKLARENRDAGKRGYTTPPYPASEVERALHEADERYAKRIADIEEEAADADLKERFRSQKLAFWGFLLVAVGSLMQAVAALANQ